jgi:catechol-2,3-dioxygenase
MNAGTGTLRAQDGGGSGSPMTSITSHAVCGVRSIHFGVADLEQALDFFTRAWGLSPVAVSERATYLRGTGADHYLVALHKRPQTGILRGDLIAPDRKAVDAIHERLKAASATDLTNPGELKEPGGGYGFVVREPSGLLLLVVAGDARHAETADAIDLPRKLSHLVFSNPNKAAIERFFIDGLGFRLIDRSRRINFLNCNADHHSVAIVNADHKGLHHVAFEMPSFDALMRGVGRLRDAKTEMGWGVGRHGPGNNIFAYFVGPEGLPVEYTAEVQQVDDTYGVGSPDDWKPVPGRMDQWGATGAPSPAMTHAEETFSFSDELLLNEPW